MRAYGNFSEAESPRKKNAKQEGIQHFEVAPSQMLGDFARDRIKMTSNLINSLIVFVFCTFNIVYV